MDKFLEVSKEFEFFSEYDEPLSDMIVVQDDENYYLYLRGSWDGDASFAIFLDDKGEPAYYVMESKDCGPTCISNIRVIKQNGSTYEEVTDSILAQMDLETAAQETFIFLFEEGLTTQEDFYFNPIFELPREGTTIHVYDENIDSPNHETLLYRLNWIPGPIAHFEVERAHMGEMYTEKRVLSELEWD